MGRTATVKKNEGKAPVAKTVNGPFMIFVFDPETATMKNVGMANEDQVKAIKKAIKVK